MDNYLSSECIHKITAGSKRELFKYFFWRILREDIEYLHYSCPQCGYLLVPGKILMWCMGLSWSVLPIPMTGIVFLFRRIVYHHALLCLICLLGVGVILTIRAAIFSFLLLIVPWVRPGFTKDLEEPAKAWHSKGTTAGLVALLIICGLLLLCK